MDLFNPLSWSMQLAAWAAPGVRAWSLERSMNRAEGERALKARNYAAAEKYFQRAVDEADALRHSVRKIQFRLQLAEAQRRMGKLAAAETTIRTALEYTARISNPSGYVQCLDALAEVFHDAGDFASMEATLEQGVRIEASMPHPDSVRMARRIHRMGTARHKGGRGEDAIPALEKALKLQEEISGEGMETAALLSELGIVHRAQENHQQAHGYLRRALRLHERMLGPHSEEALTDLHHLAGSLQESGDLDGASALYERLLLQKQLIVGSDLEELAEMQYGLAGMYISWANYARSRELLSEAVGIFKRKKGPRLAVTYETIAHVEECSGRYPEAVVYLALAGKVWEACADDRRVERAENLEHRAELLDQLRRRSEAAWLRERAAELLRGVQQAQSA